MPRTEKHTTPVRASHEAKKPATRSQSPAKPPKPPKPASKPKARTKAKVNRDKNGLNRNAKTYQQYMKERKRIRDMIGKIRRKEGAELDIHKFLGDIPANYKAMRQEIKRLQQIHRREQLVPAYRTELLIAQQRRELEAPRISRQQIDIPKPVNRPVSKPKQPLEPDEELQIIGTNDKHPSAYEPDGEQFIPDGADYQPDNKDIIPDEEDEYYLERPFIVDEDEEDEYNRPLTQQEINAIKKFQERQAELRDMIEDDNVIELYDQMPVIEPAPAPALPTAEEIILEQWYNKMGNIVHASKPVDPWNQGKWGVADLNDLFIKFADAAVEAIGEHDMARAIMAIEEDEYIDPWDTPMDYDTRHKMGYFVNMADYIRNQHPDNNLDELYDIIAAIRQILDEGYIDDFK